MHLEQLKQGLADLDGYQRVFVVFRLHGAVIGQAWLPVTNGSVSPLQLQFCIPSMAWVIWQHLAQETTPAQSLPTASVVVCTHDRPIDLASCLRGLARLAADGYEVIVVDSSPSNDSAAKLVASCPEILYLYEPQQGLNVARNRGLRTASGEIVAFTDDDAVVDKGWLPALLSNFQDPLVGVVTGITLPLELETEAQIWFEQNHGFGRGFVRKQFDTTNLNPLAAGRVGAGVNMAIRRDIVKDVGYFDEALDVGTPSQSGGDQEFFYRVLARGYRIVYEPRALVWHRHRKDWQAFRQTLYGYGVGVFAWWTRALLVEREYSLLKIAPSWFGQYYLRNLLRSLLKRPNSIPLDLALAEFWGALAGPSSYLRSHWQLAQRQKTENGTRA